MMFYELNFKKTVTIGMVIAAFTLGLGAFAYQEANNHIVERATEFVLRTQSGLWYALAYNPPWAQSAAVAATQTGGTAASIPVLLYHGTPPEGNDNPPLPQSVFIEQMRALKADGWQTITLAQFTDFMKKGTPLPAKSFLLTFDDARKESYYPVDPVLEDLGYNAVMFTITGFSLPNSSPQKPSTFYLGSTELETMEQSGRWEIESHGDLDHKLYDIPVTSTTTGEIVTEKSQHFLPNKLWLQGPGRVETTAEYTQRIENDLSTAKTKLQNLTGKNITAFAFPFNDYGQEGGNFAGARDIIAQVASSLYTFAFYQVNPDGEDPFNYPDSNALFVKRIEPVASWSGQDLVARLDHSMSKKLPYTSAAFPAGEWSSNWGLVETANQVLTLRSKAQTSGATALLNGSQLWQDYSVNARIDWKSGDAASLVARYAGDSSSFLSCAFTSDHILVQSHEKGAIANLASEEYNLIDPSDMSISMKVEGDQVSCEAGGATASATLGNSFVHPGSLGVQIWGKTLGDEALDVRAVSAAAL